MWTTIGTTVGFASNATIPCSFTRTSSTTNAAIDAMKVASVCSGTAVNNFGVATLYQAASKDVGRVKFIFTDITGVAKTRSSSCSSAWLAPCSLTRSSSGTAMQVAARRTRRGLCVGRQRGQPVGGPWWQRSAHGRAPTLTVGPVTGLRGGGHHRDSRPPRPSSSSVVPISTTRESSTTNTFVDVLLREHHHERDGRSEATARAPSFRLRTRVGSTSISAVLRSWSDANSLSATSKFLIQLRLAGDGLATKLVLDGSGKFSRSQIWN